MIVDSDHVSVGGDVPLDHLRHEVIAFVDQDPFKAGEFVLGYPDENGDLPPAPEPAALARNGSYVVFRKLHTRVAVFRQYVRARAKSRAEEELLAAKFVGRWPSGAPLTLAPDRDDPEIGADPKRNNAFLYAANDDARGLKCPLGAHARRAYPRDSKIAGVARMHRIIRRSSSYGPILPEGVLEDDGADRGILFFCLQARLDRGFEFVKTQWINQGTFIGAPTEIDPLAGPTTRPGGSPSPSNRSPDASRSCPSSWSTAVGSTCSCPAGGRLAGCRVGHVAGGLRLVPVRVGPIACAGARFSRAVGGSHDPSRGRRTALAPPPSAGVERPTPITKTE